MADVEKKSCGKSRSLLRIFVSIDMPDSVKKQVENISNRLKKLDLFSGTYVNPDSAHITLQFIGFIEPVVLAAIKKLLGEIKFDSISAKLGKVGSFSDEEQIKVIWLEVLSEKIGELANTIDKKLSMGSITLNKPFKAHITIARAKECKDTEMLKNEISKIEVEPIEFKIDNFVLKQSSLTSEGPIYVDIEKYRSN